MRGSVAERLEFYSHDEGEHRIWHGAFEHAGYGRLTVGGKSMKAHRLAWIEANGPIPRGLLVLHNNICHNKACINPEHLRLGTHSDNTKDIVAYGNHPEASKTHCVHGHPYDEDNTYIPLHSGFGWAKRQCKACNRIRCYAHDHPATSGPPKANRYNSLLISPAC